MPSPISETLYRAVCATFGRCGIDNSVRVAVALSGGPDSTALADVVARWASESDGGAGRMEDEAERIDFGAIGSLSNYVYNTIHGKLDVHHLSQHRQPELTRPLAIVIDHDLRTDSVDEARFVSECALAMGLECRVRRVQWNAAKPAKSKMMMQARKKRYQLLYAACVEAGASVLLTGHHQGDQNETFLNRFFRASGIDGLSGMQEATLLQPGAPGPLFGWSGHNPASYPILMLRPFLGLTKAMLRPYCKERGLSFVDDPTNTDAFFLRSRIRQVLEKNETEWGVEKSIANDICTVQGACMRARNLQESSAKKLLNEACLSIQRKSDLQMTFNVEVFGNYDEHATRRLWLALLQIINKREHPPRSCIAQLVQAMQQGRVSGKFDFGGCLVRPISGTKGKRFEVFKSDYFREVIQQ